MKTIGEILVLSTAFLTERKIERPRRSAEELLASILGIKRMDLYLQHDRPLVDSELERMRAVLKLRAQGDPLEYIIGQVEFYHCRFFVNRDVLIPRQETEILVDLIVKKIKGSALEGKKLWDICTGSGCIGISLKKAIPELLVTLSDLCPNALSLARKNAAENQVQVDIRSGDLLAPFKGEKADVILCNPPYVSKKEYEELDRSVKDYEPRLALVGGEEGTEYYQRLAKDLPPFLESGAQVFLEIGAAQGSSVKEIFSTFPCRRSGLIKDWSDRDRFFFLEIE